MSRIITCLDDVAEGAAYLSANHPEFAAIIKSSGPLPLRLRKGGFQALFAAIISQQISVAAADSVWRKLRVARLTGPRKVLWASDEELRACGLSRQKIVYAKSLAESGIKYDQLKDMPSSQVISTLTEVKGIGSWTAEIYVMFSLGHADVFAPGDLALQEAAKELFGLQARPNEKEMRAMAAEWSPWQSVAARALWAYYRDLKNREGIR